MAFPNFMPRPTGPSGPQKRPPREPYRPGPIAWTLIVLVGVVLLLLAASQIWTEWLWFDDLGFLRVFTTQWVVRAILFVIAGLIMGGLTWLSMWLAYRNRPVYVPSSNLERAFDRYRSEVEPLRRVGFILIPGVLGLFAGFAAQSQWQTVLLFLNSSKFGTTDPQYHMDISFYVFTLPLLRFLLTSLMAIVAIAGILAIIVHYLYGGLRIGMGGDGQAVSRSARAQLGITAGVFSLLVAVSYFLDRFSMLLSAGGKFDGAGFTVINANIPAKTIMAIIAVLVAALFFFTAVRGDWKLPALGVGLMVVSALAVGWAYPALIQQFDVNPNAQEKESPYIQRNIDATLSAYGLDDVETENYSAKTTAERQALREDAESTASIRLLDPSVVAPAFRQLEQNKPYYSFPETLTVDRYKIDGESRDTVIAVRDLRMSGVPEGSKTWVNEHTVYTHGYGAVAAYGNTTDADGRPTFFEKNIPPTGDLGKYEPRVYFGTTSPDYSIVGAPKGAKATELDYPDDKSSSGQKNYTYDTSKGGGPSVGNLFNKALYALKFGSTNLLFSDAVTSDSEILYDRDPATRVSKVAPYLTLDERVYPAVVDGRIVWIVDGYTTSDAYPYSAYTDLNAASLDSLNADTAATGLTAMERKDVNYMRNSVKATVDAYTGEVKLYEWDKNDPILKAWSSIYPGSLTPMSKISSDLMSHFRYPEGMFKVQRALLSKYHVKDASSFYSGQGFWRTPDDPSRSTDNAKVVQPPYYMTLKMPDQKDAAFSLTSTYVPVGQGTDARNVLTGFLAVDSETGDKAGAVAKDYGKLRLLQLPQSASVSGPSQVQNEFNADQSVQSELRFLRDTESQIINGNMLTLPVGGGLLYVQPVYAQSSSGEGRYPSLQMVLVSFGNKIGFATTLDKALDQVFEGDSGAEAGDAGVGKSGGKEGSSEAGKPGEDKPDGQPKPTPSSSATPTPSGSAAPTRPSGEGDVSPEALERIQKAFLASQEAMKTGDWTKYGEAQTELQKAIEDAIKK